MKCDICGKEGARQRYISRSYGKGESLLVIEDVPIIHCPNCGEGYLTAQTLREIERIKQARQTVAPKRLVSVAVFE
ncbi:type II toxin-antitoxin system MqsA family antitoxin [Candidatus Poribacteria bacterium]|nr:type II toxin-antitoxin system MqsA family antitoxin [Candidatus Poribacteria bacterium]MXY27694.1 type II toxin-antitoxin system MqsA family antitoxin [Candidatus Poribacteria bacterium]MYK18893.1 type II toxin-antitoxin system MqsA family antitoxin [Candidatus Poribacteria bacterium]